MILLTSTNDLIELTTSATTEIDIHVSYLDYNGTTSTPGRLDSKTSSIGTINIVTSPGASAQRNVKSICIRNTDGVNPNTVTVTHTDGVTPVSLVQYTLQPGDQLQYWDGRGWVVLLANGAIKTAATFVPAPATATSTGIAGQMAFDSSFFYVCTAANTWKRTAITSW